MVLLLGLTAAPMILLNVFVNKVYLRPTSGLKRVPGAFDSKRYSIKVWGFLATLACLLLLYCFIPEYSKEHYQVVWHAARLTALPMLGLILWYFFWVDVRMVEPRDAYWHFGLFALGRWKEMDWAEIREHRRQWFIKGFFLPFMVAGVAQHAMVLLEEGWDPSSFATLYVTSFSIILAIDTIFGAIGYLLTLRVLDAHIRSAQPSLIGWLATLVCYLPFAYLLQMYLSYKGKIDWSTWLSNQPILFVSWGFGILVLQAIYVWATISFGCRFSNLTNRGIIVDGPYRYMKHPAYFAKNLSWWLISVPFVAHGDFLMNLKACLFLGLTNLIYFVRAKTEESHLSADPAYRIYAEWIRHNGCWAMIRSMFSAMKERCLPRRALSE